MGRWLKRAGQADSRAGRDRALAHLAASLLCCLAAATCGPRARAQTPAAPPALAPGVRLLAERKLEGVHPGTRTTALACDGKLLLVSHGAAFAEDSVDLAALSAAASTAAGSHSSAEGRTSAAASATTSACRRPPTGPTSRP